MACSGSTGSRIRTEKPSLCVGRSEGVELGKCFWVAALDFELEASLLLRGPVTTATVPKLVGDFPKLRKRVAATYEVSRHSAVARLGILQS